MLVPETVFVLKLNVFILLLTFVTREDKTLRILQGSYKNNRFTSNEKEVSKHNAER